VELYLHSPNTPSWRGNQSTWTVSPQIMNNIICTILLSNFVKKGEMGRTWSTNKINGYKVSVGKSEANKPRGCLLVCGSVILKQTVEEN
jgi:hypothetical protein